MDNKKDDRYYIEKIKHNIQFLITHTKGLSLEDFQKDEVLLDSVMFRFIQISECIKKLTLEFKTQHFDIPWRDIQGLRNRIVHEYGNVDMIIVYDSVSRDIYTIFDLFNSIHI